MTKEEFARLKPGSVLLYGGNLKVLILGLRENGVVELDCTGTNWVPDVFDRAWTWWLDLHHILIL